ncbi:MAG: hypothetical protein R3222_08580 [Balneolaceae bacterium]|nr:hypothetical protein [Balneolaceae bacterium]
MGACSDTATNPTPVPTDPEYAHDAQPGTSANDFLADSNFTHLILEVDYMPGYAPNEQAIDSLSNFFTQRLHKNSITIKEPTEVASRGKDQYSANEIRAIEEEERSTFSRGDTLAAYMIIVDGTYQERDLLGIAYYNTSNAFFGPSYEEASSGIGPPSRYQIEAISFRHEFGHLFGLVDIPNSGTEMQTPHRDVEHGNHCDNDQCLMYYATERTELIQNSLSGDDITPLDANCIADLRANGGK